MSRKFSQSIFFAVLLLLLGLSLSACEICAAIKDIFGKKQTEEEKALVQPPAKIYAEIENNQKPQASSAGANNDLSDQDLVEPRTIEFKVSKSLKISMTPLEDPKTMSDLPPNLIGGDDKGILSGVRIGEHKDKSRLVFDLNRETKIDVTKGNNDEQYVVVLHNAAITLGEMQAMQPSKDSLIEGYRINSFDDYLEIVIAFRRPVRLKAQEMLPPGNDDRHRFFTDFSAL